MSAEAATPRDQALRETSVFQQHAAMRARQSAREILQAAFLTRLDKTGRARRGASALFLDIIC